MLRRCKLKPIAVALLAACVISTPVLASTNINEEVTVSPGRQISPRDEAVISSAASKVLRHIAEARGQLQGDKPDAEKAKLELDQSEKLLDIIQTALPTTQVKDRIRIAKKHLEYENSREVLPDLILIYASLDELVDYMPTNKAKTHLDQAKKALENGEKTNANEQLQAVDDALIYLEADLPLSATRHLVAQAKADLTKGDHKAADKALMAAESDDQVVRKAAEALVTEVRDIHQLLESDDQSIDARLENSWQRVKALSERSAETISTGWQRLRAEGAGKKRPDRSETATRLCTHRPPECQRR